MAQTAIASNGTLQLRKPDAEGVVNTSIRRVIELTVVNSEVITIHHFEDPLFLRSISVVNATTGADAVVGAAGVASIVKTDKDTTTVTFGASAAGNWNIKIDS